MSKLANAPVTKVGMGPRRAGGFQGNTLGAARRRQSLVAWLFALPFAILFVVFMAGPLLGSFLMAFTDMKFADVRNPFGVNFVGFEQFAALLQDQSFLYSLRNTLYFVAVGIPLTMTVALALALALNNGITRFRGVFRVGFYAPVVTSIVAVAVAWRFILQNDGLVNTVLAWVGINGPDWLNDPVWAMPALIIMSVWRNMGTPMIIFLAGLQAISPDVLEAAQVDGAGAWTRLTRVTIPLLRPTLLLVAVLMSVGFLQFFEEPFVMTGGGPLETTTSVSQFIYNQFGFGNFGLASAAAYILLALIAALSAVQFRLLRSKD